MNQQNIINPSVYSGYLTCVKKIESILFTSGLADGNIEMDLFIFFLRRAERDYSVFTSR